MKGAVQLASEQEFEMPLDTFYRVIGNTIDQANPLPHLSHDSRDPLQYGLEIYPVRVYETIRKLKEQQNGTSGDR